jgi:hypothetical protein
MKEYKTNPIRLCWKPEAGSYFAKRTQFPDTSSIQFPIYNRKNEPNFPHFYANFEVPLFFNCQLYIVNSAVPGGKRTQFHDLQSLLSHLGISHRLWRFHTFALFLLPFAFFAKRPQL